MADLSSLIRVQKHELDEKQRELGRLYEKLDTYETYKSNLIKQREQEVALTAEDAGALSFTIAGFLEKSKQQEDLVDQHIETTLNEIEVVRDAMMERFAELKKYELTQEERHRIEEKERKLKEGRMFDDIALDGFRRNQEDQ